MHERQRGDVLTCSFPELLDLCAAGLRARRLRIELRVFSPGLNYDVWFERLDHIARAFAAFLRCKARDVITVPMSGDDGVQLALSSFLDVLGDVHHARLRYPLRKTGGSEIYQDVLFRFWAIFKTYEKAIAEPNMISADCRTFRSLSHDDLPSH